MSLEFEFIRLKRGYLTATKDLKIGEQKAAPCVRIDVASRCKILC